MPRSVIDAIRSGNWNYEPEVKSITEVPPTRALPGTEEKLAILSERLLNGLPLWHPDDRRHWDESDSD